MLGETFSTPEELIRQTRKHTPEYVQSTSCLERLEICDINQILSDSKRGLCDRGKRYTLRTNWDLGLPSPSESPRELHPTAHVLQSPLHIPFNLYQIKNNPLTTRGIVIFFR